MLKKIRTERNLTLKSLSASTGISISQLSQFENHQRFFSKESLYKLARTLQVQPGDLLQPIDFDSDFSTPPFDHKVPDQCPFAVDERPSSCSDCENSGSCPFFTYEEEEVPSADSRLSNN